MIDFLKFMGCLLLGALVVVIAAGLSALAVAFLPEWVIWLIAVSFVVGLFLWLFLVLL